MSLSKYDDLKKWLNDHEWELLFRSSLSEPDKQLIILLAVVRAKHSEERIAYSKIRQDTTLDIEQRRVTLKFLGKNIDFILSEVVDKNNLVQKLYYRLEQEKRQDELKQMVPANHEEADALFQVALSESKKEACDQVDKVEAIRKIENFMKAECEKQQLNITEIAQQMINDGTDPVVAYIQATELFNT